MPVPLPYLPVSKTWASCFEKIASAAVPSKFTHQFLQTTIGLKSAADRPF